MKKIRFVLIVLVSLLLKSLDAQIIRVMPLQSSDLSGNATEIFDNRLNQAVSLNGLVSTDDSNRFLLLPEISVVSVRATSSMPVMFVAEVEISFSLLDNSRKLLILQETITKKGVAENRNKAVAEAVKSMKARDSKLKRFIVKGKNEIREYYETECENVIETVNAYLEAEKYDEAINELNAIPKLDDKSDCYKNVTDIMDNISEEQQEKSSEVIRNQNPDTSWLNE